MGRRWRVDFEYAFLRWIERQEPSLREVAAVVRWVAECKVKGPPASVIESPDPERPEDRITTIPGVNVDVHFLEYQSETEAILFVKDFTTFRAG